MENKKQYIELNNMLKNPFYKMIKEMPKGGLLHAHYPACADMTKFILGLKKSHNELFKCIYYLENYGTVKEWSDTNNFTQTGHKKYDRSSNYPFEEARQGKPEYICLTYFPDGAPCTGWEQLDKITDEKDLVKTIIKHTQMNKVEDYNWGGLEKYTNSYWSLIKNSEIFELYFRFLLDEAIDDNIQIIELKTNVGAYHLKIKNEELTKANNNKPIYNNNWHTNTELNILKKVINEYICGRLTDGKRIFCNLILGDHRGFRDSSNSEVHVKNSIYKKCIEYPGLPTTVVKGYDLFGEEDMTHDNSVYYDDLENCKLNLYLHSGETINTLDGEKNKNLEYIVKLASKNTKIPPKYDDVPEDKVRKIRVGHGIALAKNKSLQCDFKQHNIHVELCPLSNYILDYTPILSEHPGKQFYDNGIRVSINTDDPSIFGYHYLSVEWFYIIMAWNLLIDDIYKICIYSIEDSSLSLANIEKVKNIFIEKFNLWRDKYKDSFNELKNNACKLYMKNGTINWYSDIIYQNKYLKYKTKYLEMKKKLNVN